MNSEKSRILILDDDRPTLRLLSAYLEGPQVELITCSEIEAAECLMDREGFDVLVTDLEVSPLGGHEGMRLIRHVSCNFPRTKVIVFSGRIDEEVRSSASALGVVELLDKPAGLARLRESVGSSLPSGCAFDRGTGSVTRVESFDEVLREGCITAVLQPIISLDQRLAPASVFGVEGLARGPERSPLRNPEVFLDYASRKSRLFETELLCIEAVLVEGRHLPEISKLFINTRPRSLSAPDFSVQLVDLVRRHGYSESDIVLELTEQESILNLPAFEAALEALRDYGFGLALDDYGSGFANLHLVRQLHLDYLKIDGEFCSGIHQDSRKQAIVRSTVRMARELGISTIMEHVETKDELDTVRDLGVDCAQGYYFSVPLPGKDLALLSPPGRLAANTADRRTGAETDFSELLRARNGSVSKRLGLRTPIASPASPRPEEASEEKLVH